MANKKKGEIIEYLSILLFFTLVPILTSLTILFVEGGISAKEIFEQQLFYFIVLIAFISVALLFSLGRTFAPNYWLFKDADFHNTENSVLGKNPITKFLSNKLNLAFVSLLFFGIIFTISVTQTNFFFDLPPEQQITDTGRLLASAFPGADAESWLFFGIMFLIIGLANLFINRTIPESQRKVIKPIILIFIVILIGLLGVFYHSARYGDSETAKGVVFVWWSIFAGITLLLKSVIPGLVMHQTNNIINKGKQLFDSSEVLTGILVGLVAVALIYTLIRLTFRRIKK